jgi:predicted nuclease of predicted toxin-antitoxin system
MKLLIDMNLSPRWVDFLSTAGWEAVHWSAVGKANAPDPEVMTYAAQHGFVLLTHDLDFGAILAATRGDRPSVIQIRIEDLGIQAVGSRVVAALRHLTSELEAGCLLTITLHRSRLRMLPMNREE